jgi:hypothetical protein
MTERNRDAAKRLRAFRKEVSTKVPPGASLVDEMLKERREEVERDEREWHASRLGPRAAKPPECG